jgi:hypothetical protein
MAIKVSLNDEKSMVILMALPGVNPVLRPSSSIILR